MAPHSSTLAWKIPWTEEPGGLPSKGSHRVGHDWSDLAAAAAGLSFWKEWFWSSPNFGQSCISVLLPIRLRQFDKTEWKKWDTLDVLRQSGKWFVSQETARLSSPLLTYNTLHKPGRVTDGHTHHSASSSITSHRLSISVTSWAPWKWKWSCSVVSDSSQPGSSVRGVFQARVLEWGAIAFS